MPGSEPPQPNSTPSEGLFSGSRIALGCGALVLLAILWLLVSAWSDYSVAKETFEREAAALGALRAGPFLVEFKEVPFTDRFSTLYLPDWKRRVHSIAIDRVSDLPLGEGDTRHNAFRAIGSLQALEYLSLDRSDFGDDDAEPIAQASRLATIMARHCRLGDRGVAFLARSPALRTLHLAGNSVSPKVGASLRQATALRHLNLSDTAIDDTTLADLAQLRDLSILDLSRTKVTGTGLGVFAEHRALRMLLLAGAPIGDSAARTIAALEPLKSLTLSRTQMTPRSLTTILLLPRLEYLAIAGFDLTDSDLSLFAGQPADRKLTVAYSRSLRGEPTREAIMEFRKVFPQVVFEEE